MKITAATEHAHAADRFAREIVRFLTVIAVRLRRLMGRPFGASLIFILGRIIQAVRSADYPTVHNKILNRAKEFPMTQEDTSAEIISARFTDEQIYIQKYIELLQRKALLYSREVYELVNLLRKYDFFDTTYHVHWIRSGQPYPADELQELLRHIQAVQPCILERLENAAVKFEQMVRPADLPVTDARSTAGESIQYMLDSLENDTSAEAIAIARQELREQLDNYSDQGDLVFIGNRLGSRDELADFSVESALYLMQSRESSDLQNLTGMIEDLEITIRMSRGDAEIDIYRQSFITLMTIFDATVFDLVKLALKRDFFGLIGFFSKQDRISLERIGKYQSFEDFRDDIVEEQLKSKYLKDILFVLDSQKITLTDSQEGGKFIHLIELVLRRNIHVHNRGRVDNKYLEANENGSPKYNIYGLISGSIANIGVAYWERANRLCQNSVIAIVNWINSLPIAKT